MILFTFHWKYTYLIFISPSFIKPSYRDRFGMFNRPILHIYHFAHAHSRNSAPDALLLADKCGYIDITIVLAFISHS